MTYAFGIFRRTAMTKRFHVPAACLLATLLVAPLAAQQAQAPTAPKPSPKDTEVWEPEPKVVTPGATTDAAPVGRRSSCSAARTSTSG